MDEQVPTDAEMRLMFGEYAEMVFRSWNPGQPDPSEGFFVGFDRWLEAHDEKVNALNKQAGT